MSQSALASTFILFMSSTWLAGCNMQPAKSAGEVGSGYTYVPVDPFPVEQVVADGCGELLPLLESLPDNTVRMSVEEFNTSGKVTYGPVGAASEGAQYRVTVDYISSDTVNMTVWIAKRAQVFATKKFTYIDLVSTLPNGYVVGSEQYEVLGAKPSGEVSSNYVEYNIPIYVGLGLRTIADIVVLKGGVNISGLGAIGAEAEAESIRGSLVVQTLGVNGKSIAAALPIPSELNRTTVQNAIVSIGSIKALLHESDTVISPRVVGLYLPFPGGAPLVNGIISEISRSRASWDRPCKKAATLAGGAESLQRVAPAHDLAKAQQVPRPVAPSAREANKPVGEDAAH